MQMFSLYKQTQNPSTQIVNNIQEISISINAIHLSSSSHMPPFLANLTFTPTVTHICIQYINNHYTLLLLLSCEDKC